MAKFRITLSAFFAIATRTGVISAAVRSGLCLSHIRLKRAISPSMHVAAKSSGYARKALTHYRYKLTYITHGTVCSSLYNSVTQSTPSTFTDPSILRKASQNTIPRDSFHKDWRISSSQNVGPLFRCTLGFRRQLTFSKTAE